MLNYQWVIQGAWDYFTTTDNCWLTLCSPVNVGGVSIAMGLFTSLAAADRGAAALLRRVADNPKGHRVTAVNLFHSADFLEIQNHTLSPSQIITFTSLSRCQWHHHVWAKALRTKRSSCSMGDHAWDLLHQRFQTSAEFRLNFMLTKYHDFLKHHGMWWTTVDGCEILHHQPDETMRNRLSTRAGFRNHPPHHEISWQDIKASNSPKASQLSLLQPGALSAQATGPLKPR